MQYFTAENIRNNLERNFKRRNVSKKLGCIQDNGRNVWSVQISLPSMSDVRLSIKWLGKNIDRLKFDGITRYVFEFSSGNSYTEKEVFDTSSLLLILQKEEREYQKINASTVDYSFKLSIDLNSITAV